MAELRPELAGLIDRILVTTGVGTGLSPDALLSLVDGAALGAIAEGAVDPAERVRETLRECLSGNGIGRPPASRKGQRIQSSNDRPEIRS
jgi:hypothetical protein